MLKKVISRVFDSKISLLSSRPAMGKMAFTSEVIVDGLENNKKILIVTLENDENYFLSHIVSRISGLSISDVSLFYYPCRESSKVYKKEVDTVKLIDAIKYLQKSKLFINSNLFFEKDIVDYILEFNEEENFDLIVVNNMDLLVEKSKYLVKEIMSKFQGANSILLWNGVSRKVESKKGISDIDDINNYCKIDRFVDSNIVLYREIDNCCDTIKIVDYKNDMNIIVDYEKEFDRLKG